ncbi:hypothetical protein [Streptomyces sp. NPDC058664]
MTHRAPECSVACARDGAKGLVPGAVGLHEATTRAATEEKEEDV